jgi:hypothetical protein
VTSTLIALQNGQDYWIQFLATDPATGNPQAVTSPKMEIRDYGQVAGGPTGQVIWTSEGGSPTIVITSPSTGVVVATIAGATTKNTGVRSGQWDAFAIDPSGASILLGSGTYTSTTNRTAL